jgi:hypothetical protein
MELRCPQCCSPEVEPDPQGDEEARRCANCGERFERESALVTVLDAEEHRTEAMPKPLFTFNPKLAEIELRRLVGAISAADPHCDADELHQLLDGAQVVGIVSASRARAKIYIYPLSLSKPDPILAVRLGTGPPVLGYELKLRQERGEDPISFTVRFLEETVAEANRLAAGRAADSERLDRIAAFMNSTREWNGGDVCEFVARELHEGGRLRLDE